MNMDKEMFLTQRPDNPTIKGLKMVRNQHTPGILTFVQSMRNLFPNFTCWWVRCSRNRYPELEMRLMAPGNRTPPNPIHRGVIRPRQERTMLWWYSSWWRELIISNSRVSKKGARKRRRNNTSTRVKTIYSWGHQSLNSHGIIVLAINAL